MSHYLTGSIKNSAVYLANLLGVRTLYENRRKEKEAIVRIDHLLKDITEMNETTDNLLDLI